MPMKKVVSINPPQDFDGQKFMERYPLLTQFDFCHEFEDGETYLVYNSDKVTDDPPIQELVGPPILPPTAELDKLEGGTATLDDVNKILYWYFIQAKGL